MAYFDIPAAQGEFGNIQMAFDLDKPFPHALTVINDDAVTNRPFFESHSISLTDGELAVLDIQGTTTCYSASFDLAISYTVGGVNRTEVITDHGQPFRVTGYRATAAHRLSYSQDFDMGADFSVNRQTSPVALPRTFSTAVKNLL